MRHIRYERFEDRRGNSEARATWFLTEQVYPCIASLESLTALCGTCSKIVKFPAASGAGIREGLKCPSCGLNARVRAAISLLGPLNDARRIYVTEQSTSTFVWLQKHIPKIRGSEFEPDEEARERLALRLHELGGTGPVEFQDVTELSLACGSFDTVLSLDVLEHVPEYQQALSEFCRVLSVGGKLVATFPFNDKLETVVRARIGRNGEIQHLLEPEYHGDPISGGVLCFYHFGWDILAAVRQAGFSSAAMVLVWCPEQALFFGHWVLVATK